ARRSAAGATSSSGSPRRAATAAGSSRPCRAATVACTMLMAFDEPSDLVSTSWIPAHSSTARTGPPAITPVPGDAGRRNTTPAAASPWTTWGMVPWMRGTRKKLRFASSTPFEIAAGTSFALPYPTPTLPSPSPTTTRAVKLKRRPPLTTLETRLIVTTRSMNSFLGSAAPRRPSPQRPPERSPPAAGPAPVPEPVLLRCGAAIRCSFALVRSRWSQGEPALTGAVGDGGHAAVVPVAAAVEHRGLDTGSLGPLGDELADATRLGDLLVVRRPQVGLEGRGGRDGGAARVVDQLRDHVARGAGDDQARTLGRAGDLLADSEVT